MFLDPRLHAKIYANERYILTSSANVTGSALGWNSRPNNELIVHPRPDDDEATRRYMNVLVGNGRRVDEELYQYFVQEVGEQPVVVETAPDSFVIPSFSEWLPASRDPVDVEAFYQGDLTRLTSSACIAAERDLAALETPPSLTLEQLRMHIGLELSQHPFVGQLRAQLTERRRFGEVGHLLAMHFALDRADASAAWQTLMRWLVHFQPGAWEYCKPRHSEMLIYVPPRIGPR